nr:MAG TPA: hypothetical protein [Caudoviricetes sp.]
MISKKDISPNGYMPLGPSFGLLEHPSNSKIGG